jgi:hypothetical protein
VTVNFSSKAFDKEGFDWLVIRVTDKRLIGGEGFIAFEGFGALAEICLNGS